VPFYFKTVRLGKIFPVTSTLASCSKLAEIERTALHRTVKLIHCCTFQNNNSRFRKSNNLSWSNL